VYYDGHADSYNDGNIDEDEFFVLYEEHFSKNPEFPFEQYEQFDMDAMDDTECKAEFRFRANEIPLLAEALDSDSIFPKSFFAIKVRQLLELKVSMCF